MTRRNDPSPESHLADLLADEALGFLDSEAQLQLRAAEATGACSDEERAVWSDIAGLVLISAGDDTAELPPSLRARLLADARQHAVAIAHARRAGAVSPKTADTHQFPRTGRPTMRTRTRPLLTAAALMAAALLAAALYLHRDQPTTPTPRSDAANNFAMLAERTEFVNRARDSRLVHLRATDGTDRVRVVGEIVWSTAQRRGYCTLRGMEGNDPTTGRYELFLQDATTGVIASACVFDITEPHCDTIIRFELPAEVRTPKEFMIVLVKADAIGQFSRPSVVAIASDARI